MEYEYIEKMSFIIFTYLSLHYLPPHVEMKRLTETTEQKDRCD